MPRQTHCQIHVYQKTWSGPQGFQELCANLEQACLLGITSDPGLTAALRPSPHPAAGVDQWPHMELSSCPHPPNPLGHELSPLRPSETQNRSRFPNHLAKAELEFEVRASLKEKGRWQDAGSETLGARGALALPPGYPAPNPHSALATMPVLISPNSTLKKKTWEVITPVRHYLLK